MYGTTLTRRMENAAKEVETLNKAKAPYEKKATIIRRAKIPKGLYGCEVPPHQRNRLENTKVGDN